MLANEANVFMCGISNYVGYNITASLYVVVSVEGVSVQRLYSSFPWTVLAARGLHVQLVAL